MVLVNSLSLSLFLSCSLTHTHTHTLLLLLFSYFDELHCYFLGMTSVFGIVQTTSFVNCVAGEYDNSAL